MPLVSLPKLRFLPVGWEVCQDARETSGPGQPKPMKTEPPNSASPLPPGAGRQLKARRGSLLTFALSPWTWSGWLSGDLGSSFGQGGPVFSQTLRDAAPE